MTETHAESVDFTISSSMCSHRLGFLSQRPKGMGIPDECLTCERIFECMASKPAEDVAKPEAIPELSNSKETRDSAEECEEQIKSEELEKIEVRPAEAAKPTGRASSDDFTIENPGMLYAQWSSTVLIRRETLGSWGKVKEVNIETAEGKKVICKVYPVDDLKIGVVQIPDKMQFKLGVGKGGNVKVKPAFK